MILIVTNKNDHTADFLIIELNRRGIEYFRFNTEDYPQLVTTSWKIDSEGVRGYFNTQKGKLDFSKIKSIWYRRPVLPNPDPILGSKTNLSFARRESQAALEGIWDSIDCFWVSHPNALKLAENKLLQLKTAKEIGFELPQTIVTNIPEDALEFYYSNEKNVICKPIKSGRVGENNCDQLIYTNIVTQKQISKIELVKYSHQIFQKNIPKRREIRVTVIGEKVFPVAIDSQNLEISKIDWRRTPAQNLQHTLVSLPCEIEEKCISLVRKLGIMFGAIDLIQTPDQNFVFLEINPNGQWAWIEMLCPQIKMREALINLLLQGE